jgi:hypothetical protein
LPTNQFSQVQFGVEWVHDWRWIRPEGDWSSNQCDPPPTHQRNSWGFGTTGEGYALAVEATKTTYSDCLFKETGAGQEYVLRGGYDKE